MNLRSFTMAILVSALPVAALAESSGVNFDKQDFISAEQITRDGEVVVSVKLSKSGKAKAKKLNQLSVGKEVHSEIAGITTEMKLKAPIQGDGFEMGPYSEGSPQK